MASKQDLLQNRGFVNDEFESEFKSLLFDEKVEFLKSEIATERTLGARLLKDNKTGDAVKQLITALLIEKKTISKNRDL